MGSRAVYALLVGIDDYRPPVPPLQGCVNDIETVARILRERVGGEDTTLQLRVLSNREATRQAVVTGFREHLGRARQDDVALFYYSGHGSQEPAPPEFWHLEPDRLDETLVLVDSREPGQFDLADKELATLIGEVARDDPHVLVVLDCCHSGHATREAPDLEDGTAVRRAPIDDRLRPLSTFLSSTQEAAALAAAPADLARGEGHGGWFALDRGRHVLLSGCRASQTSKEVTHEGVPRGAMSVALERALEQGGDSLTYTDLHRWVVADVRNRVREQTPQLEAADPADLGRPFLGGAVTARRPYGTLAHARATGWEVDLGAVHGIAPPRGTETTEFAVLGHETQDLDDLAARVATARVTRVDPDRCRVDVTPVGAALAQDRTYKAVVVATPLPPVGVLIEGDPAAADALRAALAGGGTGRRSLLVEEASPAEAALRVAARPDGYRIGRPTAARPLVSDVTGADRTVAALEHMARWMGLAALHNPSTRLATGKVVVAVEPVPATAGGTGPRSGGGLDLFYDADTAPGFRLEVRNDTGRTLFCAVLDLTELYGVGSATYETAAVEIPPHAVLVANNGDPLAAYIPDELHAEGITELRDLLKVVVSTTQFDVAALLQDDLDLTTVDRTTRAAPPVLRSTLDRLVNRIAARHIGASPQAGEAAADWFATDVVVTVTRPAAGQRITPDTDVTLAPGLTVARHPALTAEVRLASAAEISRSVRTPPEPPVLRDDPDAQPFPLQRTRDTVPDFDVLELVDVRDAAAVTEDTPLRLHVDRPLDRDEELLAVAFDGEAYLPVGYGRPRARGDARGGGIDVVIERLPEPTSTTRDLRGSISILFRKLVLRRLGAQYRHPLLRLVRVDGERLTYDDDEAHVRAAVEGATDVLLYVHGIIGDTEGMARSSASTRVVPAPQLIGARFQAVLAFDYENLDTPIEKTAADLRDRLAAVGLVPGHRKHLVVVAHSMGGLVTRHLVEHFNGRDVVSHLVTAGTPNGGSPWPDVQQWATAALAFGLNRLGDVAWPARVLGGLVGIIERVDTALDEMTPGSEFLSRLFAAEDPNCRYDVVVGLRRLVPPAPDREQRRGLLRGLLQKVSPRRLVDPALQHIFDDEDNDIAVSRSSATHLPEGRRPAPRVHEVGCDHMSYFATEAGLRTIAAAVLGEG
ncbi:caspase family protein [Geodermatophilus sp. SYSU D00742]